MPSFRLQPSDLRVWYNAELDGLWRPLPDVVECLLDLNAHPRRRRRTSAQGDDQGEGPIIWQLNLRLEYGGELEDSDLPNTPPDWHGY